MLGGVDGVGVEVDLEALEGLGDLHKPLHKLPRPLILLHLITIVQIPIRILHTLLQLPTTNLSSQTLTYPSPTPEHDAQTP